MKRKLPLTGYLSDLFPSRGDNMNIFAIIISKNIKFWVKKWFGGSMMTWFEFKNNFLGFKRSYERMLI